MNLLLLQQWTDQEMQAQQNAADWGWTAEIVPFAIWLVAGVALLAIIWSAINMFKNPAGLKKFAIGLVALVVLALICWFALADDTVPPGIDMEVSNNVAHWVGTGLWMTIVLIGLGVLILIIDLIRGIFKI